MAMWRKEARQNRNSKSIRVETYILYLQVEIQSPRSLGHEMANVEPFWHVDVLKFRNTSAGFADECPRGMSWAHQTDLLFSFTRWEVTSFLHSLDSYLILQNGYVSMFCLVCISFFLSPYLFFTVEYPGVLPYPERFSFKPEVAKFYKLSTHSCSQKYSDLDNKS